ncbi:MAG TPA: MopE-related protein, partial [Solirubrobacterales bacterium]
MIPSDAAIADRPAGTDTGMHTPDAHPGGAGGHAGGASGQGGAGGSAGQGGVGGTGGIQVCNPNSPDLQTDIANCGTCFHQCIVPNATPSCLAGVCKFACQAGFFDADNDPSNGCECTKTNGGVEICDGLDNDCNGIIDDGFDFMTDAANCGACNRQCGFPFATATCVAGVCTQGPCLPDFYDRDPTIPGCETQCLKTNGGIEICDGLDNDCDGIVDDNLQPAPITCLTLGVCAGVKPTCLAQNGW